MGLTLLARLSFRYPKLILLFWLLFLLVVGFYAPKLPSVLKDHGLRPDGAYAQVQDMLSAEFRIPEEPLILLFEKQQHVSSVQFQQFIRQSLAALQGMDGIAEIVSPLRLTDMRHGNYAYALLALEHPATTEKRLLDHIQRSLPVGKGISVTLTGKAAIQADVNRASQHDLQQAERYGIPIAFVILWLAFGGIVSAIIPIVIGLIGVTGTMGIMYMLGTHISLSNFVLNVIPMVGLALSIDFALLLVSRFREELGRAGAVQGEAGAGAGAGVGTGAGAVQHIHAAQALLITMRTAGRAVLFSAVCIFLGLMGMLFIPLPMFATIALGAMTVLAVSVALTLTLVPALLSMLWPAMQGGRKLSTAGGSAGVGGNSGSSGGSGGGKARRAVALFVMRRPVRMALLASFLLIGCFIPLGGMKVAIPDASSLPSSFPSRIAFEQYEAQFGSRTSSNVYVVAQAKAGSFGQEDLASAFALVHRLAVDPAVQHVDAIFSRMRMTPAQLEAVAQQPRLQAHYRPIVQRYIQGNHMLIGVTLTGEPSSRNVMDWLRLQEREGASSRLHYVLGGEAKYQQEVYDAIFHNIKNVLLFILVTNYAVLFLAFRSVLIPLKTILMNLLSLGASFGILVWIFQEGHWGMEPAKIAIMIPVFIFGLAFGISMDYGVFLLSRIFEVYRETQDNHHAVLSGLTSITTLINSAAAIMIAVTLPFAFGEVAGVKQLGIGIAAAIFIDATIIRMMLVPSLMVMLGKWNWWAPRWLK